MVEVLVMPVRKCNACPIDCAEAAISISPTFVGPHRLARERAIMADTTSTLFLGVPLIVLGCLSSALGFALMKRSGEIEAEVPPYLAWRWLLGFACLAFLQTFCDAASLSVLPLSVVAPFAGLTIVFSLAIAASGVLSSAREMLSTTDIVGAAAVLVGVTCVSLAAPHDSSDATLAQANSAMLDPAFAAPALLALGCAASCLLTAQCERAGRCGCRPSPLLAAIGAASCGALSQFAIKVLSLSVKAMGGAPPSASVVASLFAWAQPTALLGAACLCFTAPTQLSLLQTALAARASLVVPLYQASLVSLTTLTGGVAFQEFRAMQTTNIFTYAAGLLVATAGLLALSRDAGADGDVGDDEATAEEAPVDSPACHFVAASDVGACDALGATSAESVREKLSAPLLSPAVMVVPPGQTLDEQFPSPWSAAQAAGGGGGRPPFSFTSPIRGASDFAAGVKRSSRLPAPFMMGIGVAVRETLSMRSQTVTGRARSVSDGRAISRQRADLRRVQPMFDDSPSTPRGRSASTLT